MTPFSARIIKKSIFLTQKDEKYQVISDLLKQARKFPGPAADSLSDGDVRAEYDVIGRIK